MAAKMERERLLTYHVGVFDDKCSVYFALSFSVACKEVDEVAQLTPQTSCHISVPMYAMPVLTSKSK